MNDSLADGLAAVRPAHRAARRLSVQDVPARAPATGPGNDLGQLLCGGLHVLARNRREPMDVQDHCAACVADFRVVALSPAPTAAKNARVVAINDLARGR